MTARLVMMEGPPGAGKSTLAVALADALKKKRLKVNLLPEEAIFERDEFADVGQAFKTKEWPSTKLMLAAWERVLGKQWIVSDWNGVSMIEDLPCAQPDRKTLTTFRPYARADPEVLATHAADIKRTAKGLIATLLVLDVQLDVSIRRAWRERGERWLAQKARYIKPISGYETLIDRVVRDVNLGQARRGDVIEAHRTAGWDVIVLDATPKAPEVLAESLALLDVRGPRPVE